MDIKTIIAVLVVLAIVLVPAAVHHGLINVKLPSLARDSLPWQELGGEVREHYPLAGHHVWVIYFTEYVEEENTWLDWYAFARRVLAASKLKPRHAVYVLMVVEKEDGNELALGWTISYEKAMAFAEALDDEEAAGEALSRYTAGLTFYGLMMQGIEPMWKCELGDDTCARAYAYLLAEQTGHPWAEALMPVTAQGE